jgi:hypothetical protein
MLPTYMYTYKHCRDNQSRLTLQVRTACTADLTWQVLCCGELLPGYYLSGLRGAYAVSNGAYRQALRKWLLLLMVYNKEGA